MRTTAILAASLIVAIPTASAMAADIENGEKLYQDFLCYSCHGYNGTNLSVPLANDLSGILATEAVFIAFLRQRAELAPDTASRAMPNYDDTVLSDSQAKDLYAYIKTLRDNTPEVADDVLMQQILDAAKSDKPSGE